MVDMAELIENGMERLLSLQKSEHSLLVRRENASSNDEVRKINFHLSEVRMQISSILHPISYRKRRKKGVYFVN